MRKSIYRFLNLMFVLFLFLLVVSIYYLSQGKQMELDGDSYLLSALLCAVTGLGSLVIGIIIFFMKKSNS